MPQARFGGLTWRIALARHRFAAWLRHPTSAKKRAAWLAGSAASSSTQQPVVRSLPASSAFTPRPNLWSSSDGARHAQLFENWVANALSRYDEAERVPMPDASVSSVACDVKLIAYYLPQFHPIPENDEWWGAGFTEWRNVVRAFPNFEGHYQPRVPGELGYYDLRVPEVMQRQVELARHHGIAAFCFHFYWFGGKTLLEMPTRQFLERPELDLGFCLCWANENWTRRWDGSENAVLIGQKHSPEDDEAFLRHVDVYFRDPRYVKVNGCPVLTVYRPTELPDARATTARWRALAERLGWPGLYLVATNAFGFRDFAELGFDALSEFPPHSLQVTDYRSLIETTSFRKPAAIRLYRDVVASEIARDPGPGRTHPGVMLAWDNSARRPIEGRIVHGATAGEFKVWLSHCVARARRHPAGERFVFINAWNEWAEGTYLEPDLRYGYAFLAACAEVVREQGEPGGEQ
jgi:lipopolysaccharide biosynthesis protein